MQIGIIETGRPMQPLRSVHGDYPDMFASLLGAVEPGFTFRSYAVLDGDLPGDPEHCDGWLITGSAHAVYEEHTWIAPLEAFCRACEAGGRPLVGICFGHQLVAQAFGGSVAKSRRGWGAGVHTYRVERQRAWMVEPLPHISIVVSHQDQISHLPEGAEALGGSDFCPHGIITVGENVMAMQCHPEMTTDFSSDLIDMRRERMGDDTADAAKASLEIPIHSQSVARWMVAFLKGVR